MTSGRTWSSTRVVRMVANFLIGVVFFVVGGWCGQWGFTWNLTRVLVDILRSGEFRAVPFYTFGNYSLNWHVAFFETCATSASACVGGVPAGYVISSDIGVVFVSVLEVIWFCYLLWRSFRVQ
jgi:hypothetical protein